jgi:hypothetical protein
VDAHRFTINCADCDAQMVGVAPQQKRCRPCGRKRSRALDIDKAPGRYACREAIRKGQLVRPAYCQLCAADCKPQAHHFNGYDDANALKVIWLCTKCHARSHLNMRCDSWFEQYEKRRARIARPRSRRSA